jgi:hypothetical protein
VPAVITSFYLYLFHGAAGFLRYGNLLSCRFSDNIFLAILTLNEMPLIAVGILEQFILLPTYLLASLRLATTTYLALRYTIGPALQSKQQVQCPVPSFLTNRHSRSVPNYAGTVNPSDTVACMPHPRMALPAELSKPGTTY